MSTSADITENAKLILVGDGGVGKTAYVKRLLRGGGFDPRYIATVGTEVHPLQFPFSVRAFNVWDCAGQEKFGGLRDGYYIRGDCAIVAFDLGSRRTLRNVYTWVRDVRRICPGIPIVLVGMKSDLPADSRRVTASQIQKVMNDLEVPYVAISTKTPRNFYTPFEVLADELNCRVSESK